MGYQDNPPYSLFQGSDGFWGTKDKDGNIQDEPVYNRSERPGRENLFYSQDGLCVVEFNPETGFDIIVWCSEPWWWEAWDRADYPHEYHNIIKSNIKSKRQITSADAKRFNEISIKCELTQGQKTLIDLLEFFSEYVDDNSTIEIENRWDYELATLYPASKLSHKERVNLIDSLMHSSSLTDEDKSLLCYGIFLLNYYLN